MMLNWRKWAAFKPQPHSDPGKTDSEANRRLSEAPGVQNPAAVGPSDAEAAGLGAGSTVAGEEPRGAVPGWVPPAEGTRCAQGVGAAAWPQSQACHRPLPHLELHPAGQGHTLEGCPGQEGCEELGRNT